MSVRFPLIALFFAFFAGQSLQGQHNIDFYADVLVSASKTEHRSSAAEAFESMLVPQLESDSMFQHDFKWVGIPAIYPPDSSFRIITWAVPSKSNQVEDGVTIRGAFQRYGQSHLEFLDDRSEFERKNETRIMATQRWIGALYNEIYPLPNQDSLYLLYGINPYDTYRMLHIFEVIDLRGNKIQFGYPAWENKDSSISVRKIYEVARGASFEPQIHPQGQRMVLDHLRNVPYNPGTAVRVNVPDGTYIFFDWENGKYRYNDRLFSDDKDRVIRNPSIRKEAAKRDLFGNPRDN